MVRDGKFNLGRHALVNGKLLLKMLPDSGIALSRCSTHADFADLSTAAGDKGETREKHILRAFLTDVY